ncbi:MAG: hypothetical protein ACR2N0_11940 [Rubrobacteraceae bacterium]|jgi:hypothetical protein|nr:hypothetical protein [Rubrobacter sp.]
MPQLHLYVPEGTAEILRRKARERGKSLSGYLAEIVVREVDEERWPEGFFDEVLGSWEGEVERGGQGDYEAREAL